MKKQVKDVIEAFKVVYDNCDILIIPYIFFIVTTIISHYLTNKYVLPIENTAGITTSRSLFLIPILLGFTSLIATTSVHYQLASIYNDQKVEIFEGAKKYFGRFLAFNLLFYLIVMVLSAIFFRNNHSILQDNRFVGFIITYLIISFTTFSHISMIVNDKNPLPVFKDILNFIVTRFTKIIIPTLLIFIGYYAVDQVLSYLLTSYSGVIVFSVTSIINCCMIIWLKSYFTLIYKNNLIDIIKEKNLTNYAI